MFSHKACNPIQLFICYISIKKELIWTAMNYKGLGLTCGHTQLMAQVTAGIGLWIYHNNLHTQKDLYNSMLWQICKQDFSNTEASALAVTTLNTVFPIF